MAKLPQKRWIRILPVGGAATAMLIATHLLWGTTLGTSQQYAFAPLARGNLEIRISSTGTLSPVTQVEVGTQVSGTID